jgi:hypothetical protein
MFESGKLSGCDVSARGLRKAVQEKCPLSIAHRDDRSVATALSFALPGNALLDQLATEVGIDKAGFNLADC